VCDLGSGKNGSGNNVILAEARQDLAEYAVRDKDEYWMQGITRCGPAQPVGTRIEPVADGTQRSPVSHEASLRGTRSTL